MLRLCKYLLILIVTSSGVEKCYSQNKPNDDKKDRIIDSLKFALTIAKHDTSKVQLLCAWGEQIYLQKPDSALFLWKKAYSIAEGSKNKYQKNKIEYNAIMAGLGGAANNIGFIYKNQGNIPKALEYNDKSLSILEAVGDKKGQASTLNNIGQIYKYQGDFAKALEYLNKSLKIYEQIGDKKGIAACLNNIGHLCELQKDFSRALEYYTKSLSIREVIGDKYGKAMCFNNISAAHAILGDRHMALEYLSKSLKIQEEIGDKKGMALSLSNIGANYIQLKNLPKALEYANKSMQVSKELGYPENIRVAANLLKNIYHAKGNHQKALENFELYIQMRDSINNEKNRKASIKSQLKYEYEKQAAADSVAHAKESEIKNVELQKQTSEIKAKKNQQYALFGGLGLVIIFAGFMFNRFKITQKQKFIIEEQKFVVEHQKHLVEEKQKEVLDSIHYAKRIQQAHMPSEKMLSKSFQRLMKSNLS